MIFWQRFLSPISKMPEWGQNLKAMVARRSRGMQNRWGLASIRVRVGDDNKGWTSLTRPGGPADRPWGELQQDLFDVLEAWRSNFLIRQVVRLTTAYVVGDGIKLTSAVPVVDEFIQAFWLHPENQVDTRLSGWCDELTRSGELFPVLFTNRLDGMSQIRVVPASCIVGIETDPEDYEKELSYSEQGSWGAGGQGGLEGKTWKSKRTAKTRPPGTLTPSPSPAGPLTPNPSPSGEGSKGTVGVGRRYKPEPMMLHYAINKPVGATRGEGDLTPILPWARRYTEWLKDRVRFNRLRSELSAVDIEISDDSKVEEKRQQYAANPPTGGSITVHGQGEKISYPTANIQGFDAEPDGRALRLAFAAGANVPLHFLAEGSSATRSTAAEMGDPTHRHYRMRQRDFAGFLIDLCGCAWRRFEAVNGLAPLADLAIKAVLPDISRADNKELADSCRAIVEALAVMKGQGWVTDEWAVELAFKFAGEALTQEEITEILTQGRKEAEAQGGTHGTN